MKDVGIIDNPDEAERSGSGILHGLKLAATDIKVWALAYVSNPSPSSESNSV